MLFTKLFTFELLMLSGAKVEHFAWLQKAKKKGAPNTVQKDGNNKNEESQPTLEQPGY